MRGLRLSFVFEVTAALREDTAADVELMGTKSVFGATSGCSSSSSSSDASEPSSSAVSTLRRFEPRELMPFSLLFFVSSNSSEFWAISSSSSLSPISRYSFRFRVVIFAVAAKARTPKVVVYSIEDGKCRAESSVLSPTELFSLIEFLTEICSTREPLQGHVPAYNGRQKSTVACTELW